jgi:hypothetical protein
MGNLLMSSVKKRLSTNWDLAAALSRLSAPAHLSSCSTSTDPETSQLFQPIVVYLGVKACTMSHPSDLQLEITSDAHPVLFTDVIPTRFWSLNSGLVVQYIRNRYNANQLLDGKPGVTSCDEFGHSWPVLDQYWAVRSVRTVAQGEFVVKLVYKPSELSDSVSVETVSPPKRPWWDENSWDVDVRVFCIGSAIGFGIGALVVFSDLAFTSGRT